MTGRGGRDRALWWVVALGIGSLVFLVAGAWTVDRRAGVAFDALGALGGIEAGSATVHLWLEERVAGDEVPDERIRGPLDAMGSTWSRLREDLSGASELRRRLEEIDFQLARFEELTLERLDRSATGDRVGIGTRADQAYDRVFEDLGVALASLRVALGDRLVELRGAARKGLRALVACWLLLVATATVLLAGRRRAHHRAESALAATHDRFLASQKMEAVGRLAGGIAHDINNYLAGINAQCELVLRRSGEDESVARRMRTVISTVFRASALIQQLLAFSRRQPTAPRVVDLDRVVERLEPMMVQLVGAGVRLRSRRGDGPRIRIDPVRLEQVLLNLVVNARDAMPQGGKIDIETSRRAGRCRLVVRDDGCGIAPDQLDRIFEPFFTTKSGAGASGLGLSTVLGIVEQSGGQLEVESEVGSGTTFRIEWPVADEEAAAIDGEADDRIAEGGDEPLLLVEDNRELREATTAILRSQGYAVEAAGSAEEMLAILDGSSHGDPPVLLIADLVLPGMNGRELADRLQERFPELRVLHVTGYSDDEELRDRLSEGRVALLEKPFTSQSLLRRIREVLEADRP